MSGNLRIILVNQIVERAMALSLKAEEKAETAEDFLHSARCLNVAIKALKAGGKQYGI